MFLIARSCMTILACVSVAFLRLGQQECELLAANTFRLLAQREGYDLRKVWEIWKTGYDGMALWSSIKHPEPPDLGPWPHVVDALTAPGANLAPQRQRSR